MKKAPRKLTLRRETLKVLIDLKLKHVVGGDPMLVADTGTEMCTTPAPGLKK